MVDPTSDWTAAVDTDAGLVQVRALSDRVVRVWQGDPPPSYALDPGASWDGPTAWEVAASGGTDRETARGETGDGTPGAGAASGGTEVRTAALVVAVGPSGAVTVTDRETGAVLVEGEAPGPGPAHAVRLAPGDRVFGLGDAPLELDRRGHRVTMWNTDAFKFQRGTGPIYKSVPFALRVGDGASVGLFYDNTWRSAFDVGAADPDRMAWSADGGALDLYVLSARTPLAVVEAFARLVGRTPMLPRWALGYHQSRYSYRTEAEVRDVARAFRERGIPCDALYFDIHYMDGFRVFTWDREAFPDPPALLADLAADGFRSVVIVDPGVKADDPDYGVYQDGAGRDAYVRYPDGEEVRGEVWPGTCAFPDFTSPSVRAWWGGLHAGLVHDGVDGVWNDMNEPALFSVAHVEGTMAGEEDVGTIPDHARHDYDGHGADHAQAHNVYGTQMQRATFEGLAALAPDRRPFTITRAAYAGSQRFGTAWTGDNSSTWDHLRLAAQMCLSLGVSGMPFVGTDVGGFVGEPTGELVARWTQLGALTPLFRNHSAIDAPRQEPWRFGDEVERVCREAIELRYRLLPVLYTALWQAATDGTPILRPLAVVHPADETVRHASPDAFYVGDALLAHPVVEQGQTEREAYLPAHGGGWYDVLTGDRYDGRQTVWMETPLDRLPLFARGGSVVPMGPVRPHTSAPAGRLALHVYPAPGRHTSALYDDAGDGHGPGRLWALDLDDDGATLALEATARRTGPAGGPGWRPEWDGWDAVVWGLGRTPTVVSDGAEVPVVWDGAAARFPLAVGAGFVLSR